MFEKESQWFFFFILVLFDNIFLIFKLVVFFFKFIIISSEEKYLADCVGVFAADPFFPSNEARCCSRASSKLLGAFVKSGISPLSIPTF